MQIKTSVKHLQINQANNLMFIVVAVSSVLVVFSLVSAKTLLGVSSYQHKALKEKHAAVKKLQDNVKAAESLKKQYDVFEAQNPNIIGGVGGLDVAKAIAQQGEQAGSVQIDGQTINLSGRDGDNAKIILDALPSSYDFPALISSIEKIANQDHIPLQSVGGTDQADSSPVPTSGTSTNTATSAPQPIVFSVSTQTDYKTVQTLINDLERSIRAVDISQITLSGNGGSMTATIQATTYYQSPISLKITEKVVQ